MPKNLEQEWRVVPKCRETPILETLVSKNQGKFMPKIFKLSETAPLELHSCGCSMHFLLELTPESSSHSSPICFHPAPCIEILDSRAVILEVIKRF